MAYASSNTILDNHYNEFATGSADGTPTHSVRNVNTIWGTGSNDKGYGQTNILTKVDAGDPVEATHWATMISRMSSIASHQNTSLTSMTSPTVGDPIAIIGALDTNITTLTTKRMNNLGPGTGTPHSVSGTGSWTTRTTHTVSSSFTNGDKARYFFNAGGYIDISFTRSGGTSHSKNDEWTDLCNKSGIIRMKAHGTTKVGGSGTVSLLLNIGYYDLTTSYQLLFRQYADSSPYSSNYLKVEVKSNGTQGSNQDAGSSITFKVTYEDAAADNSIPSSLDAVNGTITTALTDTTPSAAILSNTWGSPTFGSSNYQS